MAAKDETAAAPAVNDAYTGMLGISLCALIVGCVLLYLDYSQYPDKPPTIPKAPPPAIAPPAEAKNEPEPKAAPKGEAAPNPKDEAAQPEKK